VSITAEQYVVIGRHTMRATVGERISNRERERNTFRGRHEDTRGNEV
jgi:hypothetical protein